MSTSEETVSMHLRTLFVLLLCIGFYAHAQTTLSPGDIAIILGQSDNPEKFAFYTKVDLDAGTEIYFTDCGADAAGFKTPTCNEGAFKYTAPAGGISAGLPVARRTALSPAKMPVAALST